MTTTTNTSVITCSSCGARLARDHHDTICSPCRRRAIESDARRGAAIARDRAGITTRFTRDGLHGLAAHLECTIPEALEVVFAARLVPAMSARRQAVLRGLVALEETSHVMAADVLGISRWTVATYRAQLGLDRCHGHFVAAATPGR